MDMLSTTNTVLILGSGVLGLLYVFYLTRKIMKEDAGTDVMSEIHQAIRSGASTFLRREYRVLAWFAIIMAVILVIFVSTITGIFFLAGTIVSALAGYLGMNIATQANVRTAAAARRSWRDAMKLAFNAGGVMGFTTVSFGILGLTLTLLITGDAQATVSFAFGASAVALFLRVGGGIFTKSADVGADLVGKVEQSIPEDDPRNAASIADNVGDNVGDIAGMGSDLYESYISSVAAAMVLGLAGTGAQYGPELPLLLASLGIIVSIIGVSLVRPPKEAKGFEAQVAGAQRSMNVGVYVSNILMIIGSFFIINAMMDDLAVFWALITGLVAGFLISLVTEYYTSSDYGPAKGIARASESGPALTIIEGMGKGMISTVGPVLLVAIAIVVSFAVAGLSGIAIAAVGMLINLAMLLSMDCYGPIADNAAGIAEMSGLGSEVRERCEALDAVGNTTAALGKGFSIGSAGLVSLAWLATYFSVADIQVLDGVQVANLMDVSVLSALLVGAMLPYLFSSLALRGVSIGSFNVVAEVRRQFKEIPGIMERTAKPDYVTCVAIATTSAIKAMLLPGVIVIVVPLLVGFLLGPTAVAGLLVGALASGFILAIMMANSGGAWDNAKKYIESGQFGGKGGEAHKASVIGDTVGDPFKDTAGPSLNILIKLVGIVANVFGPVFVALIVIS